MPADARQPLLVADGDNLAHRAFHALPSSIRGRDGQPINAVVGVVNAVLALWDAEQPRALFTAWDTQATPTYRHRLWPSYQAGREFAPEILTQLAIIPSLLAECGIGVGQQPGYEADDLMASATALEIAQGGSCVLVTTDRDAYQLVTDRVVVVPPARAGRPAPRLDPAAVEAHFGVPPGLVPDFKALAGDPSDNIPGARGIGPKTAATLLRRYGSLDAVLQAWAAEGTRTEEASKLRAFRDVATMRHDAAISLPASAPDWTALGHRLRDLGAERLAARLLT